MQAGVRKRDAIRPILRKTDIHEWEMDFGCHAAYAGRMSKNMMYVLIGALIVVVVGLGIYVYDQETKPAGVEVRIGESGISVEGN
jgi:hypothetical protein